MLLPSILKFDFCASSLEIHSNAALNAFMVFSSTFMETLGCCNSSCHFLTICKVIVPLVGRSSECYVFYNMIHYYKAQI